MHIAPKDFLQELVKRGTIDQATADRTGLEVLQQNMSVEDYLLQQKSVDPNIIYEIKAQLLGVSYVDISKTAVDPQSLSFVPEQLAKKYAILPYSYNPQVDTIFIATDDPLNIPVANFLQQKTGKRISLVMANPHEIQKILATAYAQGLSPEVSNAVAEIASQEERVNTDVQTSTMQDAPIAKIVRTVLEFAIKNRASDIHIEPQETKTRVRYRIDGILEERLTLPRTIHNSLVSRIKILSQMKIDERRVPQDGRFSIASGNEEVDLRVSTLPVVYGEKIVMRLLKKTGGMPSLSQLGLRGNQLQLLEQSITKPYGIILVTGPTGSGKTTTLYSVLHKLNKPGVNIVTIEDPVEYQIPGINQVQINPLAGLTFSVGLRAFLRQDPNIILVGEIRDKETAQLAIQAALTGHLVFSTLHTNDAATAIPRLIDLGGEPFLVASVVNASVAQRICRRTCPECREWYVPDDQVIQDIKTVLGDLLPRDYSDESKPIQLVRGKGCQACNMSGYLGRIAIFEVLQTSSTLNKFILQQSSAKQIEQQAIAEGLVLMKQDGYLKALDGVTTIEEVLRVAEI